MVTSSVKSTVISGGEGNISSMVAEDSTVSITSLLEMISEPVTTFALAEDSIIVIFLFWATCVFFPIPTTSTLLSNP